MMPIKSVCEIRHQSKRKKLPVSSIQKNLYTVNVGGGGASYNLPPLNRYTPLFEKSWISPC